MARDRRELGGSTANAATLDHRNVVVGSGAEKRNIGVTWTLTCCVCFGNTRGEAAVAFTQVRSFLSAASCVGKESAAVRKCSCLDVNGDHSLAAALQHSLLFNRMEPAVHSSGFIKRGYVKCMLVSIDGQLRSHKNVHRPPGSRSLRRWR